jgi:CMP-N,N'-diacetyllegionaminic acid synthase
VIDNLSVLALIPARGGSKGLPGKNILPVAGRPLLAWTIHAARASRYIDRLVLSSDDSAIIAVAEQEGCEVPFRRDVALATDEVSSVDVVIDAIERLPSHDVVVLLQPTSPLRVAADIDATLETLFRCDADACVTVRPAEEHPYWTFRIADSGHITPYCTPADRIPEQRQQLPMAWCLNGAVYAARIPWFLRTRTFISAQTVGQPMPAERSADIDTNADLELVECLLRERTAATSASQSHRP